MAPTPMAWFTAASLVPATTASTGTTVCGIAVEGGEEDEPDH